jgi:hypothetical protein
MDKIKRDSILKRKYSEEYLYSCSDDEFEHIKDEVLGGAASPWTLAGVTLDDRCLAPECAVMLFEGRLSLTEIRRSTGDYGMLPVEKLEAITYANEDICVWHGGRGALLVLLLQAYRIAQLYARTVDEAAEPFEAVAKQLRSKGSEGFVSPNNDDPVHAWFGPDEAFMSEFWNEEDGDDQEDEEGEGDGHEEGMDEREQEDED